MRTSSALGYTHSGKPRLGSFHGNSLANRSRRKYHGCLQGTSTPLDRNDHLTSSDLDDVTMPQAPHGLYVNLTSSSRPSGFFAVWAATVPMVTVSVVTLAANGTVLLMFVLRPSLRRGKNAYIASLALADFLIGCYMPLLALEEVGLVAMGRGCECRMYVTGQQALVYVSLLSILLITLDRCWSLRAPFSYRAHHTRRLAASLVSAVWTVSVVIYALPIFLWNTSRDEDNNRDDHHHSHGHDIAEECGVPYADSLGVVAVMSGLLYLLPLAAMWAVNCALYTAVRQRRSVEVRRSVSVTDTFFVTVRNCSATKAIMVNDNKPTIQITEAPSIASPPSGEHPGAMLPLLPMGSTRSLASSHSMTSSHSGNDLTLCPGSAGRTGRRHSCAVTSLSPQLHTGSPISQRRISLPDSLLRGHFSPACSTTDCRHVGRKWSASTASGMVGSGALGASSGVLGSGGVYDGGHLPGNDLVREVLVKQDRRVACCLGLLLTTCTLCWLPEAFLSLLHAHCPTCLPRAAHAMARWLLLANSAVNPFLYGLLHAQFRNVARQWFLIGPIKRYRFRDTNRYLGVNKPTADHYSEAEGSDD